MNTGPAPERTLAARAAFDGAAEWYDQLHEDTPAWRASRERTQRTFLRYFRPGDRLLELNCGTGIDAIAMARHGMHVHATDLSPAMITAVRKKVDLQNQVARVTAEVLGFDELHRLQGCTFDGAYSNFGGLNCTDRLREPADRLAELIRPGGVFVATFMTDFCLWETLSMLLRFRWSQIFRRRERQGVRANLGGNSFTTYYFSPRDFVSSFRPHFQVVEMYGLNILTPPLNHMRAYGFLRPFLPLLYALDDVVARLPFFRRSGDHAVIVLRRSGT